LFGPLAAYFLMGLSGLTSMLVASMFCAHTLIAYPIVSRLGLTKQPSVVIAVTGTIFTVIGSLIVLAAVTGVYRHGAFDMLHILAILGGLALYCVLTVYIYPRLTRWFFKRYNDPILQFIFILGMAMLSAHAVTWAGVESVFGAFFAGIVLNRYVPARSPLMTRLEFVGNAIFIPYFLIGVGMLINLGALAGDEDSLRLGVIMSVVAMASKWVAAWIAQKCFRLGTVDRSIIYQLTNAHTAVALAVVTIGFKSGIFGEAVLNGTILMILVTCTVSSLGTFRAATQMKTQMLSIDDVASPDTRGRKRPVNTLIPVANPVTARELIDMALFMRGRPVEGSNMYALYVRSDNSSHSRALGRNSLEMAETVGASVDVDIHPIERYDLNFVTGVLNAMTERDISELFIGLHRRTNVIDSFFGDKVEQLLRATNKMIIITRTFIPVNTITRVVVAVPDKAQYETGFPRWVEALGNLTSQLGCRIIFCCPSSTARYIRAVIARGGYDIRHEYRDVEQWDDFILLANHVLDDDLLVIVNARRTSVSFNNDLDNIPGFLQRYFSANNLAVIYPEQFGSEPEIATMADNLSADLDAIPSPLLLKLRQ
ncbi:MAG: cation:proton antiporter, partial [Paramuribaculum sp.]|nr:cation:proton antiporter [Paramuribaculum sp.]